MTKLYSLGRNRYVSAKKQDGDLHVTIAEEGFDVKTVTFPSIRWARFVEVLGQLDETVNQLTAKQVCLTQPPPRRQVLSVSDDGVRLRRHPRVLLQPYGEGGETVQEGDRPMYSGMGSVEGRSTTTQQETCGADQRSIIRLPVGQPKSRRGTQLYGVTSMVIRAKTISNIIFTTT